MKPTARSRMRLRSCLLFVSTIINFATCDARSSFSTLMPQDAESGRIRMSPMKKNIQVSGLIGLIGSQLQTSQNTEPYGISTPFSLPPFESLSPLSQPEYIPPSFCLLPPPSVSAEPPPGIYTRPPPIAAPTTPKYPPSPEFLPNPPPKHIPSPPQHAPIGPPFEPPVVCAPASVPPSPQQHKAPTYAVWCVAKPTVPDLIMQAAMDYACGSGADCKPIQPNGSCYQPDTLLAHASFAFNSYFQSKKASGGTCDFGGAGMLVTTDPSSNGCRFIFV